MARAVPSAPPPAPSDPLLVFAAATPPGGSGVVDGQRVRVGRAYTAASGRDCRELLVGSGLGERATLACHDPVTGWSLARPLLRGGGIGRP
jgi:hypothetical protein